MICAEVNGFYFFPLKKRCEPITLVKHCPFLLKCLYHDRKVSRQVYVLGVSISPLSTILD